MPRKTTERVLVTGIGGFAGAYLTRELLEAGYEVSGVLYPGEKPGWIAPYRGRLRLGTADILKPARLAKVLEQTKPHRIVHLAGWASVGASFTHPREAIAVNATGTVNLLEICRSSRTLRRTLRAILLVGSSEVYGKVEPSDVPIGESQPLAPVSPYGVGKAAADLAGYSYHRAYGLPVIRTRSFNHTGPNQTTGFVVPDFCTEIARSERRRGKPVMKVGNLEARRDIADVRDVVRAYRLLVECGEPGEAYNVGSGVAHRIGAILEELLAMAVRPIATRPDPKRLRPAEIPVLCADIEKIRVATGWEPVIPWQQTLSDALQQKRSELQ